MLRRADDLRGASDASLDALAPELTRCTYHLGESLFEEGQPSTDLYLIEEGTVDLTALRSGGEEGFVAEMGPGGLLGDMTALTARPRTSTAIARTDVVAWRIPADALERTLLGDPGLALAMLRQSMELVLDKDMTAVERNKQTRELKDEVLAERETTRRLLEQDQLKNERVAMMTHDIRSPLAVVIGAADMLEHRWKEYSEAKRAELLQAIRRQGKNLLSLVDDALHASSLESGSIVYEIVPFDLSLLVHELARDLMEADKSITLAVSAPTDLPEVKGDEKRNRQILFNLISNAIKFSPTEQPIDVTLSKDGTEARVAVRDRGIGLPEDQRETVFEKFTRLRRAQGGIAVEGTGLGLYICRSMVEAQGGRIWVEPTDGPGTTFCYTLPLAG